MMIHKLEVHVRHSIGIRHSIMVVNHESVGATTQKVAFSR